MESQNEIKIWNFEKDDYQAQVEERYRRRKEAKEKRKKVVRRKIAGLILLFCVMLYVCVMLVIAQNDTDDLQENLVANSEQQGLNLDTTQGENEIIEVSHSEQATTVDESETKTSSIRYELLNRAVVAKENSSENRNFNMQKACESLDGLELEPGDEFNWYGDNGIGKANKENGYKEAVVLVGGVGVPGYGGGVCQVATALYNCIYGIGIEADEHHPHSKPQSYVQPGMVEAAVSDGQKNFIFHNTKDYTIAFDAYEEPYGEDGKGGQVTVSVYKVVRG